MTRIHVGNIPYAATEAELRTLFEQFGQIRDMCLLDNPITGKFRGDMFISMDDEVAWVAIKALHGFQFGARKLRVTQALVKVREHARKENDHRSETG